MPVLDTSRIRSNAFRPLMRLSYWLFVINFMLLVWLGAQHVESPFIELGQFCTAFYFSWFLVFVPLLGIIENTLFDLAYDYSPAQSPAWASPYGTGMSV
jgi:ubiquinol-cytochrome c reductase cytochrome b subunit